MQLPQELQRFEFPALILIADKIHAQFWLAHNDTMEEVDLLELERDTPSDSEGRELGVELKDDNRLHQFIHMIVSRLDEIMSEGVADTVHLVMEAELSNMVVEHSSHTVQESVGKVLHLNLMKEEPLEVVTRLLEVEA